MLVVYANFTKHAYMLLWYMFCCHFKGVDIWPDGPPATRPARARGRFHERKSFVVWSPRRFRRPQQWSSRSHRHRGRAALCLPYGWSHFHHPSTNQSATALSFHLSLLFSFRLTSMPPLPSRPATDVIYHYFYYYHRPPNSSLGRF